MPHGWPFWHDKQADRRTDGQPDRRTAATQRTPLNCTVTLPAFLTPAAPHSPLCLQQTKGTQSPIRNCCACSMLQCFLSRLATVHLVQFSAHLFAFTPVRSPVRPFQLILWQERLPFSRILALAFSLVLHTGRPARHGCNGEKPVKRLLKVFLGQLLRLLLPLPLWHWKLQTNCCTSIAQQSLPSGGQQQQQQHLAGKATC